MYIGGLPVPQNAQQVGGGAGGGGRPEVYNFLPYTPSDTGGISYFDVQTLNKINDGTDVDGAVAFTSPLPVIMTFAAPVYFNRMQFVPGQFNGPANAPRSFTIYRGAGTTIPLFSFDNGTPYISQNFQVFELFNNANFDIPSNVFRIDFVSPTGTTSVLELEAYGAVA